jgi:hypothetical protein
MTRIIAPALSAALGVCVLGPFGAAQTTFGEVEPNGPKSEATLVNAMQSGDALSGGTTGTSVVPGQAGSDTADTFRIRTAPLPLGIWRHRLQITTPGGITGHVGTLRGLEVALTPLPTITGIDARIQQSSAASSPPRTNQWFGFGREEEIFYRIEGNPQTNAPYMVTLTSEQLTPTLVASTFAPGTLTLTTEAQGHTNDTEIHVYDADLRALAQYRNDDTPANLPGGVNGAESTLVRTFADGVYFVALSRFNTCDAQLTGPDDTYQLGDVLDFPNALVSSNVVTGSNVSFAISDAQHTLQVSAQLPATPFEIVWFKLIVGTPPPRIVCAGDGSARPCPCGNDAPAGAGTGCLSSLGIGGALAASGQASLVSDTLVLSGSAMPAGSSALYFQGTTQASGGQGALFGDGLLCASGTLIRLATRTNVGGSSQYPAAGELPISQRGLVSAPGTRVYQAWYRNSASFCTSATFNLTNGIALEWGA